MTDRTRQLGASTTAPVVSGLPLHDATACTGEGCPRASACERHLLMQRRREHIAAGGTPAPWSQMAPPPDAAEHCDLWIATPCP